MKKLIVTALLLLSANANAFDIYALGASAVNCKGVSRDKSFTVKLEEFLQADGFDIHVINGGVNGDKPIWMANRVESVIANPQIKMVIFQPSGNEMNPRYNLEGSEKVLTKLQAANMITIYASPWIGIQSEAEGAELAKRYNAYYYGPWSKGVIDNDPEWRQFDYATPWGGHMTAKGCEKVARQMSVLIEKIVVDLKLN